MSSGIMPSGEMCHSLEIYPLPADLASSIIGRYKGPKNASLPSSLPSQFKEIVTPKARSSSVPLSLPQSHKRWFTAEDRALMEQHALPALAREFPELVNKFHNLVKNEDWLKLRAFINRIPKGFNLHTHLIGAIPPDLLVNAAVRHGMYYNPKNMLFISEDEYRVGIDKKKKRDNGLMYVEGWNYLTRKQFDQEIYLEEQRNCYRHVSAKEIRKSFKPAMLGIDLSKATVGRDPLKMRQNFEKAFATYCSVTDRGYMKLGERIWGYFKKCWNYNVQGAELMIEASVALPNSLGQTSPTIAAQTLTPTHSPTSNSKGLCRETKPLEVDVFEFYNEFNQRVKLYKKTYSVSGQTDQSWWETNGEGVLDDIWDANEAILNTILLRSEKVNKKHIEEANDFVVSKLPTLVGQGYSIVKSIYNVDSPVNIALVIHVLRHVPLCIFFLHYLLAVKLHHSLDAVVGTDIVGPEVHPYSQSNFWAHLAIIQWVKKNLTKILGPGASTFEPNSAVHVGELDPAEDAPCSTLTFCISEVLKKAKPDRVSHLACMGTHRNGGREVYKLLQDQNVAVIVCPTSSSALTGINPKNSQLLSLKTKGVLTAVGPDDPTILRTDLLNEYVKLIKSGKISFVDFLFLIENSIKCSFFSESSKEEAIKRVISGLRSLEDELQEEKRKRSVTVFKSNLIAKEKMVGTVA